MKKNNYLFGLLILSIAVLYACSDKSISTPNIPEPTETIVKPSQEESEDNAYNREMWIESMHRTAPGQNWRELERNNAIQKLQQATASRDNGTVILGDSLYYGEWTEKGSNNQAGSVIAVQYLQEENMIYTVSAGGTLWRGPLDGSNWAVVNESLVFDSGALKFIDLPNGEKRMILSIARIPHYSDDMGLTWSAAEGITSSGDFWSRTANYETITLDDGSTRMYCLSKFDFWSNIKLFFSEDLGESYEEVRDLFVSDFDQVAFCKPHHSNEILIGRPNQPNKMRMDKLDKENVNLSFIRITDLELNSTDDRIILIGTYQNEEPVLYSVANQNRFMRSIDEGQTWEQIATFNDAPWDVGFYVSPSDASQVYYGEVEAHRLTDASFEPTNLWWEYYSDVVNFMHADIMSYNEYEDQNGNPFLLTANHGGITISRDYLRTTQNISLAGLNVAQYYDVITDPNDPDFVYVGTQDQGFQRATNMTTAGIVDFDQVISGDYGHLTMTNDGQGLWMTFPGGAIDYYNNPQSGFSVDSYRIESDHESSWLPAMAALPGSTRNEILVAGGNINGGTGSHIIKLEYFGGIRAEQFPFDFRSESNGGVVTAIEASTINPDIIYASTDNGFFFTSTDGGQNFEVGFNSINDGHFLYGASIYASTINENEVWIAGSGYNSDGVFYSDDNGRTFALFSKGLPPTLVFEITANSDESQFYAATEAGPYVYLRETQRWEDLSQGNTPAHTYWSVEYVESLDLVRFGTYGRGIWDFQFSTPVSVLPTSFPLTNFATIYPNPVQDVLNLEAIDNINTASEHLQVEVYNSLGQLMLKHAIQQRNEQLDFSQLAPGTYIVQISDGQQMQIEKVIKQ